jgi:hypothetical protein
MLSDQRSEATLESAPCRFGVEICSEEDHSLLFKNFVVVGQRGKQRAII